MTTESPVTAQARSGLLITQFLLAGTVWGSSFLFMKVALEGVSPAQLVWTRLLLGALTLGVFMLVRREPLPRAARVWMHATVLAVIFCVVPFLLFSWAQQHVSSGLASIYNATTPIMTAIMAWAVFRVEKLRPGQILGILVGMLGVMVIVAPWQGLDLSASLVAQGVILCATAFYGFSLAYMRRFLPPGTVPPLTLCFLFVGIAAVIMLLSTPIVAASPVRLNIWIVLSLLALGSLGTGVAYVWNQNLVDNWGPTRTSMVTYMSPVIGVVLGILVLGEQLHWYEPVGALLVLLGIMLAQRRPSLPTPTGDSALRDPAPRS